MHAQVLRRSFVIAWVKKRGDALYLSVLPRKNDITKYNHWNYEVSKTAYERGVHRRKPGGGLCS